MPPVKGVDLKITRKTPTTVLYTVSTRHAATSLATRLQRITLCLLRILTGLVILIVLLTRFHSHIPSVAAVHIARLIAWLPSGITSHGTITHLKFTIERLPWPHAVLGPLGMAYLVLKRQYATESLLVMRGLGVQISSSGSTYLVGARTRFIPCNVIQDVFIHEAFIGFEVRFYLAIVVENEEEIVVVFPNILPRRQVLETVWRGTRACLYESKG